MVQRERRYYFRDLPSAILRSTKRGDQEEERPRAQLHPWGCLSGSWGAQLDLHDPHLLPMAAAERHLLETEYDEYASANASGAVCCHSAALILMAILLLCYALALTTAGGDEDPSTFFTLFLLRAARFLLPCYIMARAMNVLQHWRQRQEAAMAAVEVALLLQGQSQGLRFTTAVSGSTPGQ